MKKNTHKIISISLIILVVSFIFLSFYFYSLNKDLTKSYNELNEEHKKVFMENENNLKENVSLTEKIIVLKDEANNLSVLLEQSEEQVDKLSEQANHLHSEKETLKKKVAELEKKLGSTL